jgi:hypothetical protein
VRRCAALGLLPEVQDYAGGRNVHATLPANFGDGTAGRNDTAATVDAAYHALAARLTARVILDEVPP